MSTLPDKFRSSRSSSLTFSISKGISWTVADFLMNYKADIYSKGFTGLGILRPV